MGEYLSLRGQRGIPNSQAIARGAYQFVYPQWADALKQEFQ